MLSLYFKTFFILDIFSSSGEAENGHSCENTEITCDVVFTKSVLVGTADKFFIVTSCLV